MPKKKSVKKPLLLATLAILAIVGLGLILEKTNVINLYNGRSDDTISQTDTESINDVDYSPASSTDNDDINNKKANGTVDQEPAAPTNDTTIQITFIAHDQDSTGGPLEVRTQVDGVTNGDCTLTLTHGATVTQKLSEVVQQNNYFACEPFSVKGLANGEWTIKLKVTSGDGRTNEASTSTTIN